MNQNELLKSVEIFIGALEKVAEGDLSFRLEISPDVDINKLYLAFNAMLESISQREKYLKEEAKLLIGQSEKMASLGGLVPIIAHELNNPLTGILTYSGIMREDLKNTKHADDLKIVIDETIRCRDIVRGLLDFSRESDPVFKPFDLNLIITDVISFLEKINSLNNIEVEKKLEPGIPAVRMNINLMKSVINNLTLNAVDVMPQGGKIRLETGYNEKSGNVLFIVEDNGIGIKKENIGFIFNPFFTGKEVGKGTGLGLYITYNIVKRHGGQIKVESEEGAGTTFTVELPASKDDSPIQREEDYGKSDENPGR